MLRNKLGGRSCESSGKWLGVPLEGHESLTPLLAVQLSSALCLYHRLRRVGWFSDTGIATIEVYRDGTICIACPSEGTREACHA